MGRIHASSCSGRSGARCSLADALSYLGAGQVPSACARTASSTGGRKYPPAVPCSALWLLLLASSTCSTEAASPG